MRVVVGEGRTGPVLASAVLLVSLGVLAVTVLTGTPLLWTSLVAISATLLVIWHKWLLRWETLLGTLLLVILFIPIRRYILPGSLPFQLEPYRVLVALFIIFWISSLLIDPRVRLRRSGLEGPLFLFALAALVSVIVNWQNLQRDFTTTEALKALTFFASFLLVFYMVVSVARGRQRITMLLKVLVGGGVALAVFAVIESRTGYNAFNQLDRFVPFLEPYAIRDILPIRGVRLRAYGPAEHAIALSAALALLVPLAVYLANATKRRHWWFATGILIVGILATVSRTGVMMLVVELLVLLWLKPAQVKRLWPLFLPGLIAVHLVLPGTLGTLKQSFFPPGGLVNEQRGFEDTGRVGDLGPTFEELSVQPLFGVGFGSRIHYRRLIDGEIVSPTGRILDDQWLATMLETGVVGAFAWLWLFVRTIRRLGRAARQHEDADGWLFAGLAAAITAFAAGMFTYDAFSFVQVTFFLYILLGFASSLLLPSERSARVPIRSLAPAR